MILQFISIEPFVHINFSFHTLIPDPEYLDRYILFHCQSTNNIYFINLFIY